MHRVPVESSSTDSVGYDNEVLEVRRDDDVVHRCLETPWEPHRSRPR